MEPLLPSLRNLPVFYTVLVSLLLLFGLSGFSLYRRLRRQPPEPGFRWLKGLALLPLWLLCLLWTGLAVFMGFFAGAMAGSWILPLLSLGLLPLLVLLSWGYYRWIRGGTAADAGALLLVPALVLGVFFMQRLWLCEPLAWSGLGYGQLCTARLYEQGEGGAIRNYGAARDWYRQAAKQGVAAAGYAVAGFTFARDEKIAWYTRAADHGHAGAAYRLYWLLENTDPEAALRHLQAAVSQGHAGAQYRLGVLHLNASGGVGRDLSRTRELWLQSARSGYISAIRALALAYANGDILFDYDLEASRHWSQQASRLAPSHPEVPRIEQLLEVNWERRLQATRRHSTKWRAVTARASAPWRKNSRPSTGWRPQRSVAIAGRWWT